MGKGRELWQRLAQEADLTGQPMPGVPIVELAGDRQVLIENHAGVREYSPERIGVKVKFGTVFVCGRNLELRHMSREQLVICGSIQSVELEGRG